MEKLLVIDEDASHCMFVGRYLEANGFCVETRPNAFVGFGDRWRSEYAIVILEVMLSGGNGYDILRQLRSRSAMPILLTASRDEEFDPIIGLELDADDYLKKPFHPRELLARIRAILRRTHGQARIAGGPQELQIGDIGLDSRARTAWRGDIHVSLTAVEFNLLELLLREAGRVVPRAEIANQVLGRRLHSCDRSIDMHISRLRKKLQDEEHIETVRSVGYSFRHSAE